MAVFREDGFFLEVHSDSVMVNGYKLPQEKFVLGFRKKEFHNEGDQGLSSHQKRW